MNENDPVYEKFLSFYEGISHLVRDDLDEFITQIYQKLEHTNCPKMRGLLLDELNGALLAANRDKERLEKALELVELWPTSGYAWKALARIHYHGNHNKKDKQTKNNKTKAYNAWYRALGVEQNLKSYHFIASDFCLALACDGEWSEIENIIPKMTKCLNPDIKSMDDVMPIEIDWLKDCPNDAIDQDILNQYFDACEIYIQAKQSFLEKEGLL
jgi:hypothetical protein